MRRPTTLAIVLLFAAGMTHLGARSTTLLSFEIDDAYPIGGPGVYSDAAAFGDDPGTTTNLYNDYRLDSSEPSNTDPNFCVQAEPAPPGNLFIRLNRKLDGEAGVLRCDRHGGGTPRQFRLHIANADACNLLRDSQAGLSSTGALSGAWGEPCVLGRNDNPRIRLATLYKPKAKTTNIDFLEFMDGSTVSFEIRSEGQAPIQVVAGDPTMKSMTSNGLFRLVKFEPGVKARAVGPAFSMPVKMVFKQWTQ